MYFPYLRGRQYELLALRELLSEGLISKDFIRPIIEPIKETSTFLKTVESFVEKEYPIYTIINPQVGEYEVHQKNHPILKEEFKNKNDAVMMNDKDFKRYLPFLKNSQDFITIYCSRDDLKKNEEIRSMDLQPSVNFIEDSTRFKRNFTINRQPIGMIRDAFNRRNRNVDYLDKQEEFFSDDHLFYKEEGYMAFSDYSVIGSFFAEGGFAPIAVAIHIVYFDDNNTLRIRHFVSETNDDISNPAGKFQEALQKLVQWSEKIDKKNDSKGLNEFRRLLENKQYPGLGVAKKLSIMHHLEIMDRFLRDGNRSE
ncbi:MAG TPA: sce7725 family protein [Lactovum miscens]|uniref:sce7725 family protein n=1 Tax=Lactovum miscens TaxID=190387 RepID=UPI002ED9AC8B